MSVKNDAFLEAIHEKEVKSGTEELKAIFMWFSECSVTMGMFLMVFSKVSSVFSL